MKVIVYKTESEPCTIINPAPELFNPNSGTRKLLLDRGINFKNDQEIIEWVAKCDLPKKALYSIIDISELPKDNILMNAWIYHHDTKSVIIDEQKAKEIYKNKLRILRNPLFNQLDIEYQKADENNDLDLKKSIIQKKQELRDLTKDLPDDLKELKLYYLKILDKYKISDPEIIEDKEPIKPKKLKKKNV